jgi:hypothetical protein
VGLGKSSHGSRPERPTKEPLGFSDGHVVDARLAATHQAVLVELPLFVAVRTLPGAVLVAAFVDEANRDAGVAERPYFLDQTVVALGFPFAFQERLDRRPSVEELRAISPAAVFRVRQSHSRRISAIPGIFGHTGLLGGGFCIERRHGRAGHGVGPN